MRKLRESKTAPCGVGPSPLRATKGSRPLWAAGWFVLLGFFGGESWSQDGHFLALSSEGSAAVHISEPTRDAYIVDGGRRGRGIANVFIGGEPVLDSLRARGIETLVFICSHPDADHLDGLLALVEEDTFDGFRQLWFVDSGYSERVENKKSLAQVYAERRTREPQLPAGEPIDVVGRRGDPLLGRGDPLLGRGEVTVETFHDAPRTGVGSEHDRAIITTIRYGESGGPRNRVVDTDDASDSLVKRWVEWVLEDPEARRPDTLVVPHHGARTTDIRPLLQSEIVPTSVVIPVNRENRYDHPSALTLNRLKEALGGLDKVHITAVDGPVEVRAQGVTSAQSPGRREAYFAELGQRQRMTLVRRMIEREERLLFAEGETRRTLARAQSRDGEVLRAAEALAREFGAPLAANTGRVLERLERVRANVASGNPGASFPGSSSGNVRAGGRQSQVPRGGGGRRAVFEASKRGRPVFGGVIMGADATLSDGRRPVSAEIVVVQGRPEIRVSLVGAEGWLVFTGVTETELAVALDFVSGSREGTHPDDVGLVGVDDGPPQPLWRFSLHPAVANTAIGGNLMRLDMLPAAVFEAGVFEGPTSDTTYQWRDREAVLEIVDGQLRVLARNEPRERLLAFRFHPEDPSLAVEFASFLRVRSWTFEHIERFAEAVLVLRWLLDHGVQPTGEDGLTAIRWPVEPKLHLSDLAEELEHIAARNVN